jgi:hypothetical protein
VRRLAAASIAIFAAACDDSGARLYVEITSELQIPSETNALAVRVEQPAGAMEERSFDLGEPPRDTWPQVLPIIAGNGAKNISIAVELRVLRAGQPSIAVGYSRIDATLPRSGESTIAVDVPRACEDLDGDGYGNGFGCASPDCDDTRRDVPDPIFCPVDPPPPPPPDGGVPPPDGGVADPDGGVPDSGAPRGVECPAGSGWFCDFAETCVGGQCWEPCAVDLDCDSINEACLENFGICICRMPCDVTIPGSCPFGGTCIDDCCGS